MAADHSAYTYFYVIGRQDDELELDVRDSLEDMAEKVASGIPLRDITYQVATRAGALLGKRDRIDWCMANVAEITEAGGDSLKAWSCYLQGRIDLLAHNLELEVIAEVQDVLDDTEAFGDDDEHDGDDDSDEEGEEGEDEEDEEESEDEEEDAQDSDGLAVIGVSGRTRRKIA